MLSKIQTDKSVKMGFEKWSKENLIDFLKFLQHRYPQNFALWLLDFDELKKGN